MGTFNTIVNAAQMLNVTVGPLSSFLHLEKGLLVSLDEAEYLSVIAPASDNTINGGAGVETLGDNVDDQFVKDATQHDAGGSRTHYSRIIDFENDGQGFDPVFRYIEQQDIDYDVRLYDDVESDFFFDPSGNDNLLLETAGTFLAIVNDGADTPPAPDPAPAPAPPPAPVDAITEVHAGSQLMVAVNASTLEVHNPGQDKGGIVTFMDDGVGVKLEGNFWKMVLVNYTVTENTVLEFDFSSGREAEVSALGFTNSSALNDPTSFQIHGEQDFGIGDFNIYDGSGDWTHFEINVGTYFTGAFTHLTITSDDDGKGKSGSDGQSFFRNIVLHENTGIDAVLEGDAGSDELFGDNGLDRFVFNDTNDIDIIHSFDATDGDVLDIRDIISLNGGDIEDFVQLLPSSDHMALSVDLDGSAGGATFIQIGELRGQSDLDVATLYANGQILVS